ncbi:K(+)-transporting ATPase subunit C [Microcoleus sp. FACHB-672]|uniref:K(+)-transporting ATPase subunit C n=1 Tax=Microcoleus sp. FACHB-672 TaxID=2692825 RepID=UPI0016830321|nr:K(+)-transporting ATPase subunit C [Microcoleus sp. FACHB-672]MBD2043682.1 K(+)-transporting ATPase subunit C [Microcoleus sp. FACHB-672]
MSLIRETIVGLRMTLILWVLTALIYPFFMLGVGLIFPYQANGSLIKNAQGQVVGSALIGQPFASERYFWSRPSTTNYSTGEAAKQTGISGASNLAPSNPDLVKRIQSEVSRLNQANIKPTADLVYTSGSSLDPHISEESARTQIQRVAKARGLDTNQVEILISKYVDGRFLGIFGESGVNTLKLNLALDALQTGK